MHCTEPTLDELLLDPVAHAVMRRDGLTADDVRQVIQETRQRLSLVQSARTSKGRLN